MSHNDEKKSKKPSAKGEEDGSGSAVKWATSIRDERKDKPKHRLIRTSSFQIYEQIIKIHDNVATSYTDESFMGIFRRSDWSKIEPVCLKLYPNDLKRIPICCKRHVNLQAYLIFYR